MSERVSTPSIHEPELDENGNPIIPENIENGDVPIINNEDPENLAPVVPNDPQGDIPPIQAVGPVVENPGEIPAEIPGNAEAGATGQQILQAVIQNQQAKEANLIDANNQLTYLLGQKENENEMTRKMGKMKISPSSKVEARKPEKFQLGQDDFERYLKGWKRYVEVTDTPSDKEVLLLLTYMGADVTERLDDLGIIFSRDDDPEMCYNMIKEAITSIGTQPQARAELRTIKQGEHENIMSFAGRVRKLTNIAFPNNTGDAQRLVSQEAFVRGIRSADIKRELSKGMCHDWSFEQLYRQALEAEGQAAFFNSMTTQDDEVPGPHESLFHVEETKPKKNIVCYFCGGAHYVSLCKQRTCTVCGKKGHGPNTCYHNKATQSRPQQRYRRNNRPRNGRQGDRQNSYRRDSSSSDGSVYGTHYQGNYQRGNSTNYYRGGNRRGNYQGNRSGYQDGYRNGYQNNGYRSNGYHNNRGKYYGQKSNNYQTRRDGNYRQSHYNDSTDNRTQGSELNPTASTYNPTNKASTGSNHLN